MKLIKLLLISVNFKKKSIFDFNSLFLCLKSNILASIVVRDVEAEVGRGRGLLGNFHEIRWGTEHQVSQPFNNKGYRVYKVEGNYICNVSWFV